MARTIKKLKDKDGNYRLIAPQLLNHEVQFNITGVCEGTGSSTSFDNGGSGKSSVELHFTKVTINDESSIQCEVPGSKITDATIDFSKFTNDAVAKVKDTITTDSVSENETKALTSKGAYASLSRKANTTYVDENFLKLSGGTLSGSLEAKRRIDIKDNTDSQYRWALVANSENKELRLKGYGGRNVLTDLGDATKAEGEWVFGNTITGTVHKANSLTSGLKYLKQVNEAVEGFWVSEYTRKSVAIIHTKARSKTLLTILFKISSVTGNTTTRFAFSLGTAANPYKSNVIAECNGMPAVAMVELENNTDVDSYQDIFVQPSNASTYASLGIEGSVWGSTVVQEDA